MIVKKILSLKNVGRFKSLAASGDVEFKKLTLIYGLNGHGKTTLVGVLRSLMSGDPAYIDERHTLGVAEPSEAEIRLEKGNVKFCNGAWSTTESHLEIFDSIFVNDNVFTGEHVGPEHRKNLYEVVVGATAVLMVKEIDGLDAQARQIATENSKIEESLGSGIQAPFALDEFVSLVAVPDLTKKIADCTTQLNAVRKQREILARRQIETLSAPALPEIMGVLAKSVAQVSKDAEQRVRQHMQRLDHRGEAWIRQGFSYLRDDHNCPFCGQDASAVDLLRLYGEFFPIAYGEHVVEIERTMNLLDQTFGDAAISAVQKRVLENDACIKGWADLAELSFATFALDRLEPAWRHARMVVRDRLQRKASNPSRGIEEDDELAAAIQDYQAARAALTDHNREITRANAQIGDLKTQAAATKAETLEADLRRLRNMEIRASAEVGVLVDKLLAGKTRRKEIDEEKKQLKASLESTAAGILQNYQESINRLLQGFGANFTIANTRLCYPGGKASSTYQIELNNTEIDIGDARTPRGKPCFRTALSTGDKSTLAFAFFLARLEQENDISDRCVVIDDPLSSFDSFRIAHTQQEVAAVARRAAQTIVLSHDAFFLKGVLENSDKAEAACLRVVRAAGTHTVRPWSVSEYFLREAHQEYFLMKSYLEEGLPENGDLTSVARAIRPYIEGHLRQRFPGEFSDTDGLGTMVDKIEAAPATSGIGGLADKAQELRALNVFSRGEHHGSATPTPRPTDDQLQRWVRRAIELVQLG